MYVVMDFIYSTICAPKKDTFSQVYSETLLAISISQIGLRATGRTPK